MSQSKILTTIAIEENSNFNQLSISVYYNKETHCHASGKSVERGLYLKITPSFVAIDGIFRSIRLTRFTGFSALIQPLGRFSSKKLAQCKPNSELLHYGLSDVVLKNNISLKTAVLSEHEHILEITSLYSLDKLAA